MFQSYKKYVFSFSEIISAAGGIALFAIILVTCLDVIGSKVFKIPLQGSYEIVFLAQLVAIALSAGDTLIYGRHVHVDMFIIRLPKRPQKIIAFITTIMGFILFLVISWQGFVYADSLREAGEVTGTIKIPLFPFAYILGISGFVVCLVYVVKFIEIFKKSDMK
jgi:TRAP-type C4-dicarboxylate transport system permease small subunit